MNPRKLPSAPKLLGACLLGLGMMSSAAWAQSAAAEYKQSIQRCEQFTGEHRTTGRRAGRSRPAGRAPEQADQSRREHGSQPRRPLPAPAGQPAAGLPQDHVRPGHHHPRQRGRRRHPARDHHRGAGASIKSRSARQTQRLCTRRCFFWFFEEFRGLNCQVDAELVFEDADGIAPATGVIHQAKSSAGCKVGTACADVPPFGPTTAVTFSRGGLGRAGGRVRAFAAGGMLGREARGVLLEQDACDSSSGRITLRGSMVWVKSF